MPAEVLVEGEALHPLEQRALAPLFSRLAIAACTKRLKSSTMLAKARSDSNTDSNPVGATIKGLFDA
jgi:hypothetical protein